MTSPLKRQLRASHAEALRLERFYGTLASVRPSQLISK